MYARAHCRSSAATIELISGPWGNPRDVKGQVLSNRHSQTWKGPPPPLQLGVWERNCQGLPLAAGPFRILSLPVYCYNGSIHAVARGVLTNRGTSMHPPLDYAEIGLMCGLEVHQQLLTDRKLFCRCPAGLYMREHDGTVLRHMRPTLSELGEYDGTARWSSRRRRTSSTCFIAAMSARMRWTIRPRFS